MRRICALLLGSLLLLTLAGCGGGEGEAEPSSSSLVDSTLSEMEPSSSQPEVMTVEETVDTFKRLSPQVLGLEGTTLSEYEILYKHANVLVDGIPCLQITVYGTNEAGMNDPMETYLYARDGSALYQLDVNTDTISKLDMGGGN